MKNLKLKKEDLISEPQKKTSPENNYDDEKVSQVVDEALKDLLLRFETVTIKPKENEEQNKISRRK